MRLGSRVAVAVVEAGSCISYSTPSPGTSICRGCSPNKKTHKKAKNKAKQKGRAVLRQMYLNLRETNMHVTEAEKLVG